MLFPAAVLVGAKRSRTCLRGLITRGARFRNADFVLADPWWLVPCCNGVIVWPFTSVRTFVEQLLVTGGLLYGFLERQRLDSLIGTTA